MTMGVFTEGINRSDVFTADGGQTMQGSFKITVKKNCGECFF
jgi:hypothetical protein